MPKTLFPFKLIEPSKRDPKLTAFGGLPLILETYQALGLAHTISSQLKLKQQGWSEDQLLQALISLQVAGGDCMDDVDAFNNDAIKELMGYHNLPASASIRRFLHRFDEDMSEPRTLGEAFIPEENEALQGLNAVYPQIIKKIIKQNKPKVMTLDVDATISFSSKQSCLATYKGGRGYQPIQAIWAETGLIVCDEFRDGNVPAQSEALAFLKKCESNLPRRMKLRIRSDGAWYQHEVMSHCMKQDYEFSISADLSQGLMRFVREIPESGWKPLYKITKQGRVKTDQEWAELRFTTASLSRAEIKQRMQDYRYIVIRKPNTQPDLFAGAYLYNALCSNMHWNAVNLIRWHYERCGTIEQVQDVLKNDLAGGKMPCGTFGANAAWWRITCITHNIIQCLKILALPPSWYYTRLKKLRFRLFCLAGRIIRHARQVYLQLTQGHPNFQLYQEAREKLATWA